jgi:hypothetical protein
VRVYWTAPVLWPGATFVIVAGGPSLTAEQVNACRDRHDAHGSRVRMIVINDGYRLAPWADVLYFCDCKWWGSFRHGEKLKAWQGLIVRMDGGHYNFGDPRIKVMRNCETGPGLATQRDGLNTGRNSGYQAINLAVHLGAKRIVLLGYDMQAATDRGRPKTHWFGDHPGGTSPSVYDQFLPWFDTLVKPLAAKGIEIVNCTPGSRLRAFPQRKLGEVLDAISHQSSVITPSAEAAA